LKLLPDESWAKVEVEKNILIKTQNNDLAVQVNQNDTDELCQPPCRQSREVELCTEVEFIKNKNTHNRPLLWYWVRFTEKIIRKI